MFAAPFSLPSVRFVTRGCLGLEPCPSVAGLQPGPTPRDPKRAAQSTEDSCLSLSSMKGQPHTYSAPTVGKSLPRATYLNPITPTLSFLGDAF